MLMSFSQSWLLWLLPLVLLPLWLRRPAPLVYSSLAALPADPLSDIVSWGLRGVMTLTIAALLLALSGPYQQPQPLERVGKGAQIVLLLDRSRSMDEEFANARYRGENRLEEKGRVARDLLAAFAAGRHDDLIAMLIFSTHPIPILPLTDKPAIVQAAIRAGNIDRGLSKTNVGAGLQQALDFFRDQPYTGSRIVLLVSDGGARLDLATRIRLKNLFQRYRAALYWIYLRTYAGAGLEGEAHESAPERDLHRFFQTLGVPYRVYTAEDPQALEDAIADVGRLQSLPIHHLDTRPGRDLSGWFYGVALVLIGLLIAAQLLSVRRWQ
jgi:mxaC protein